MGDSNNSDLLKDFISQLEKENQSLKNEILDLKRQFKESQNKIGSLEKKILLIKKPHLDKRKI